MKQYEKFQQFYLHWVDYVVFGAMITLSTGIGIYYGYLKTENANPEDDEGERQTKKKKFGSHILSEYLLGSRKLKIFPVAMSLVGSYVSGVTMIGTVSEIYNYGTQYSLITLAVALMAITISYVYVPVFMELRVRSAYSYLEMRFSSPVRSIASIMFVLDELLFLPIILYVPSIAFSQVTGIDMHLISFVICVICVIYTLLGGIKAVVHTDAWQIMLMFISVVVIAVLGTIYTNGLGDVFKSASEGDRLVFFNTSTSFYERHTLWGVLIGGYFYWTSFNAVNQTMVQRYLSLPSLENAQCAIGVFAVGLISFITVCCYAGLLVYDFYKHCDPLTAELIKHDDQLLPVYVMQTVGHLHGVPGLFIAGVFGAALSSLSVVLNSTALVFLEDIVKGLFRMKLSIKASSYLVKGCVLVLGCCAVSLVFVLEKLSGILSVATSVTAIAAGTTGGVFTLGMLVPWCNNKGALAGAFAGAVMSGWISFGSQIAFAKGDVFPEKLPVSVTDCPENVTLSDIGPHDESNAFPLYRLSFHWINPIGVLSTVIIGTIVSFITGPTDLKTINPKLISPALHRFLPDECFIKETEVTTAPL